MEVLNGLSVFKGYAAGKLFYHTPVSYEIKNLVTENVKEEVVRFKNAKDEAVSELLDLYDRSTETIGEEEASIFQIHAMMLEDDDYTDYVVSLINERKLSAEYAVSESIIYFQNLLINSGVDYIAERSCDVEDISKRIIKNLVCNSCSVLNLTEPGILVAEDFTPGEMMLLDRDKVLGIVTKKGSYNSHTSILARAMNIPTVVAVGDSIDKNCNMMIGAVDSHKGIFYLEPDNTLIESINQGIKKEMEEKALLQKYMARKTISPEGKKIHLYANAGSLQDIEEALKNDAEGIGLFRSEFLFLQSSTLPTEEEQFKVYKQAAVMLNGKKIIIRTLDAGADKHIDYLNMPHEENSALGVRAIRYCLKHREVFVPQLRALLRASAFGNLSIMFPMISSVEKLMEVKEIVNEVKNELIAEKIAFNNDIELGIMIETPAAALISDELASLVDFFSIGTNDLTQYTLALDRQNPNLTEFYYPHHRSIFKLIDMTVKNAHKKGIWAGICGELAADTTVTDQLLKYGMDEFSVTPPSVLGLRKEIIEG